MGRKGGIRSGEKRRLKKSMRELVQAVGDVMVSVEMPDGKQVEVTYLCKIVLALMQKAANGDVAAAKLVSELLDETSGSVGDITFKFNFGEK